MKILIAIMMVCLIGYASYASGNHKTSVDFSPSTETSKPIVGSTPKETIKPSREPFDIGMSQNYEKADIINKHLKGGLAGKGRTFVSAGLLHNVNPFLLASISIHETGNGTSKILREKNNVAGLMKNGITFRSYKSIDDSIFWFANLLEDYYIAGGRNDLESIGRKFCPVGAKNDPTGLNQHWIPNIEKIYERMTAEWTK